MANFPDDKTLLIEFANLETREAAFTQIVRKYQERTYWHIRKIVIDHDDTDDVLQNVFIKMWKHLENFREESQLFTWIYRIATNESLTFIERNKKKANNISLDNENYNFTNTIKADKNFDASKLEWKLQLAIQQLPEKQRIVFNLRYYEEMPYEQMSKILETSEGALKASYHHAAKKVEEYILNH